MKTKIITAILVTLFVAGMFFVLPVVAGPSKSNGDKAIPVGNWIIIVTKRGWRQWKLDADGNVEKFANVLFTEGMNQEAIDAHVADGWTYHPGLGAGDARYPYVGGGAFIYKSHLIPAGP